MRKVVVTGAECSGKSTLSEDLAEHYGVLWVPEMARQYLVWIEAVVRCKRSLENCGASVTDRRRTSSGKPGWRTIADLRDPPHHHLHLGRGNDRCSNPWVVQQTKSRPYDLWLLCRPDIPWVYDPQRENPHDRDRLFVVYEKMLKKLKKPYVIIEGGRRSGCGKQ